jgi:tetraprenyl-beta-curcumene synthase
VLIRAAARELTWGLPAVAREVRGWRARALAIPDAPLREDALRSLANKRAHTDGAALFSTLPRVRVRGLPGLLAAYEIMCDFLDCVSERGAEMGQANGRQLHLALVDALTAETPLRDYYLHHPWRTDGGYLRALVEASRAGCGLLPSYEQVRPLVVREALRAQVLAINHDPDPARRDATLCRWAAREFPSAREMNWFELTGAASATLATHVLLALGSEPLRPGTDLVQVHSAYLPWISIATTMLDSYVDQVEDAINGDHSYVGHYPSPEYAATRIGQIVRRSLVEARALPSGEWHALITACMAAMYLSKDSARTRAMRASTKRIVREGGSLTRFLLPILRLWRIVYAQRAA